MIRKPTYQAANAVAPAIEEHFIRHLADARKRGENALDEMPDRVIAEVAGYEHPADHQGHHPAEDDGAKAR